MRISGSFGSLYDPYRSYTDILKKSINMSTEPGTIGRSQSGMRGKKTLEGTERNQPGAALGGSSVETEALGSSGVSSSEAALAAVKAIEAEANETASVRPTKPVSEIAESVSFIRDFDTIGRNSDLSSLDEDVRFAGAKADSVLSQYQYFVNG